MKRYVKASSGQHILMTDPQFDLIETHGVGINDTPWTGLKVVSKGAPAKHVIEIRLDQSWADYNGEPIQHTYRPENIEIAHGMRMKKDTLEETKEYIQALEDAVEFAERVNRYIYRNPQWLAK